MAMTRVMHRLHTLMLLMGMLLTLLSDGMRFLFLCLRPSPSLAAENLFLRKQLALYQERQVRPRRATDAIRIALVWLGPRVDWRPALGNLKTRTFLGWHRLGVLLFWRSQTHPG